MMLKSRETVVSYSTPLGLHHIMGKSHHYGPGPWVDGGRPDWTSLYYHRADSLGIGFDRTSTGSMVLDQYTSEISEEWGDPKKCPEKYLLWFHHLPWSYQMKSGNSLWDEICFTYDAGVKGITKMNQEWGTLQGEIDDHRYKQVLM